MNFAFHLLYDPLLCGRGLDEVVEEFSLSEEEEELMSEEDDVDFGDVVDRPGDYEDDECSSDEEEIRNRIGNIPMEWYDDYDHIGYDIHGGKVGKSSKQGDQLDKLLDRMDNPDFWRTVRNPVEGEEIVLKDDDVSLIDRLKSNKFPDLGYNPYEPWVDLFSQDKLDTPIVDTPEPKRRFIPSRHEHKKVMKLIRAIRNGWIKPRTDESENRKPSYYDLWSTGPDPNTKTHSNHIPAPKLPLPGNEESYNPPEEYLPTEEEKMAWENADEEDRKLLSKKYSCLRHVPAYPQLINEKFDRCLDLYLCPRKMKMKLNMNPEDLLPKLPKPKDLKPFPSAKAVKFSDHEGHVYSIDSNKSGEFLVSGGEDKIVRIWESSTGRVLSRYTLPDTITSVKWDKAQNIIAAAAGTTVYFINSGLGDRLVCDTAERTLSKDLKEHETCTWYPVTDGEEGLKMKITHHHGVTGITWHASGKYLAVTMRDSPNCAVLIHNLQKASSQKPFNKSKGQIQQVAFHPNKPFFFVLTQRYVRVYNLVKAVHPKGDNLIVGSYDKTLVWFDMDLSTKPYKSLQQHKKAVRDVCFHSRLPLYSSVSDDCSAIVTHGMVYDDLVKNPLIVPVKVLRAHKPCTKYGVLCNVFHPSLPWLFTGGSDVMLKRKVEDILGDDTPAPEDGEDEVVEEFSLSEEEMMSEDDVDFGDVVDRPGDYEDDECSSDEEEIRNRIGNIPMEWYDDYDHIGYDIHGGKVGKSSKQGDQLDKLLDRMDNPDFWRTVRNPVEGEEIVLKDDDVSLIDRLKSNKFPDLGYNPYEPWVDLFSQDKLDTPIVDTPEPKRRFIPSRHEHKKVMKLIRAIRNGWIKPRTDESENRKPSYYDLWSTGPDPNTKTHSNHIPAPKLPLPGNEESYNPPEEYLPTEEEKMAWENADEEDRQLLSKKYSCLRHVPAYPQLINEKFDRCLDLYLCPRKMKMKLNMNPEDLLPKLPKPRDLKPFPSAKAVKFSDHEGHVYSIDSNKSGEFLVSGGEDKIVRIWESSTGRVLSRYTLPDTITSVKWDKTQNIIAAAAGNTVYFINSGLGDRLVCDTAERTLSKDLKEHDTCTWYPVTDGEEGLKMKITHHHGVTGITWHASGKYLAVTMRDSPNCAVLIHNLQKASSQKPFNKSKGQIQQVAFHPNKPFFFVLTQRYVRVYNLVKQAMVRKLVCGVKWASCMAVHPKGDNLIVGSYDKTLVWFDMDLSTKPYKSLQQHKKAVRDVCFHSRLPLYSSVSDDCSAIVTHGMVYDDLVKNPLIVPVKVLRAHKPCTNAPSGCASSKGFERHPASPGGPLYPHSCHRNEVAGVLMRLTNYVKCDQIAASTYQEDPKQLQSLLCVRGATSFLATVVTSVHQQAIGILNEGAVCRLDTA
eukprot:sb/3460978/